MSSNGSTDRGVGGIIHKVCRDFRRKEIEPVALELDEAYDPQLVRAVWSKSLELDLPSMLVPEELGGVGQSVLTAAQVLDEVSGACAGVAAIFACHLVACIPVIEGGENGTRLLRALAGEDKEPPMLALAFPEVFEVPNGPRLAERDKVLTLEGSAQLVPCASLADHLVLFAEDAGGITAVVVDMHAPGVSMGEPEEMLGLHTVPFCDVACSGCGIGAEQILGERGAGEALLEKALSALHGFLAAIAMGTARTAHTAAYRYAQERFQFGKLLIEHQEIRRMLAVMVMKIEMGTAGYLQALAGDRADAGATLGGCAQAKIFCTDAAQEIILDAIQIHGGYGYMKETGLEKVMRDVKMLQLLGVSNRMLEVG
jgi:alkylation response protein AidB-like acyl-CoA dehydrogenase